MSFTATSAHQTFLRNKLFTIHSLLTLLALVLALLITTPAFSDDFQKGMDAAERGDYAAALKQFLPLAEQGDVDAQYNSGVLYDKGWGVPQNYKTAIKWYKLAAEHGNAKAQYNLGITYYKGRGVLQDYVRAHMWLNIATANGQNSEARDLVAQDMTPSQLEEAQRLAREWVEKHS